MTGNILPGIGRNGLVNSVRKLTGGNVTGFRPVSDTAEFIAGMVATLVDDDGTPKLAVADNTSTNAVGIFWCHKTTSFYRPIVEESVTVASAQVILKYANVLASSVKVTSTAGAAYDITDDYTLTNISNGIIGIVGSGSGGAIGATETILVSYRYKDANLTGIDQTLGSGNAAVLEDPSEVATLVYDTARTYVLNTKLYVNADGIITNATGGVVIGKVTKVPSSDSAELNYKLQIAIN